MLFKYVGVPSFEHTIHRDIGDVTVVGSEVSFEGSSSEASIQIAKSGRGDCAANDLGKLTTKVSELHHRMTETQKLTKGEPFIAINDHSIAP